MADRKISDLTALTTPATGDLIPIVDVSEAAAADKNKSITVQELFKGVPDGTAAAPGLAFESDDGNGMFLGGTDILAFSTGGSQAVTIDASRRVGIGTSSPIFTTDILSGTANTGANVNNPSQLSVTGPNVGLTAGGATVFINSNSALAADTGGSIALTGRNTTGSTNSTVHAVIKGAKENATSANGDAYLAFATQNHNAGALVERMRIDSSGRVGIGTTSPTADGLHIVNSAQPDLFMGTSTNAEGFKIVYNDSDTVVGNVTDTPLRFVVNNSERARIDGNGLSLGISSQRSDFFNSTSVRPTFQIEGAGTDNRIASIVSNNTGSGNGAVLVLGHEKSGATGGDTAVASGDLIGRLSFQGNDGSTFVEAATVECYSDGAVGTDDMPGRLTFSTTADGASSPTERMRIRSDGFAHFYGDTGVTSASNYHGFEANGTTQWTCGFFHRGTGSNPYGIVISYPNVDPNSAGNNQYIACAGAGTKRFEVRSNGGVANYQANDANLCDEREKKNIEALDSTWGCLKNWELKKFHYNEDADTDDKKYGVIAQQIAPHCPEVITDWVKQKAEDAVLDDDGNVVTEAKEEIVRMGVKEQQMMWMAIKALQEAQTRIETLEAEVAALKGA